MDLKPIEIFIDADACPVKDETYKVAQRYGLKTWVVSNAFMQIPQSPLVARMIVDAGPDVADDGSPSTSPRATWRSPTTFHWPSGC